MPQYDLLAPIPPAAAIGWLSDSLPQRALSERHFSSTTSTVIPVLAQIQTALDTSQPLPLSITADYASHEVTVIHSPQLSGNEITRAALGEGFEVHRLQTADELGRIIYEQDEFQIFSQWRGQTLRHQASATSSRETSSGLPAYVHDLLNEKHMEHCVTCRGLNEKRDFQGLHRLNA